MDHLLYMERLLGFHNTRIITLPLSLNPSLKVVTLRQEAQQSAMHKNQRHRRPSYSSRVLSPGFLSVNQFLRNRNHSWPYPHVTKATGICLGPL